MMSLSYFEEKKVSHKTLGCFNVLSTVTKIGLEVLDEGSLSAGCQNPLIHININYTGHDKHKLCNEPCMNTSPNVQEYISCSHKEECDEHLCRSV